MMKMYTKNLRLGLKALIATGALVAAGATFVPVMGQEAQPDQTAKKRAVNTGRDPFKRFEPPKIVPKRLAGQASIPSIQDRISAYKAQKVAAMNARMPAPKPTTALLLSEIQVIGITRTPRGYAAIIEATPIKLSYVIYPGEPFFDGQLVAIEDNRLIFRHETVFTDGRRERSVETKALRQPSPVNVLAPVATAASGSDQTISAAKP